MDPSVEAVTGRWERELRKGSTRLAVLAVLTEREGYGYEILQRMRSRISQGATESTVYPLLHELEAGGFLVSRWKETSNGLPPRKYYRVTSPGHRLFASLRTTWQTYKDEVDAVIA